MAEVQLLGCFHFDDYRRLDEKIGAKLADVRTAKADIDRTLLLTRDSL